MDDSIQLEDIPLDYSGITLNIQDIDLMLIERATSVDELKDVVSNIGNSSFFDSINFDDELDNVKEQIYSLYQDELISKEDYIKYAGLEFDERVEYLKSSGFFSDSEIGTFKEEFIKGESVTLIKRIEYLMRSGFFNEDEMKVLNEILANSNSARDLLVGLSEAFGSGRIHNLCETIAECEPVERSGIKDTDREATRNLIDLVKNDYNSITIDAEAKYGEVILPDRSFDFRGLDRSLEFAKSLGKEVRLNALIFYMDCPESLYGLEKNTENSKIVKDRLTDYVDAITKHIMEAGYGDTVRSVDVFNELLNRFPMDGDTPYMYRGDIDQTQATDNTKAGWLKHLSLEDLCDVISVARQNMKETDFMYNDDHLEDPKKLEEFIKQIKAIQEYEKKHNVKIINSIGTQMHLDNNVSVEEIANEFKVLSELGLPIEITEFDLAMTSNVEGLSDKEIEEMRAAKIKEISECIAELKDECNIRGCTIWSKTDSQNFRVTLANEELIRAGKEPIETLHGGYYTEEMKSKKHPVYNYHTHTSRCGHAEEAVDEEYVAAARKAGIKTLGFSDHIPNTDAEFSNKESRMHISEVEEYLESMRELQNANSDMEILVGYEAEYDPAKRQFLSELRSKVDYMILGQHFVKDGMVEISGDDPSYPLKYADSVCEAIRTGLFDIVAHPDVFMSEYHNMKTDEDREEFLKNAAIASKNICEAANEMGIPVELNLYGAKKGKGYPNSIFWDIASELGVKTLSGADAHSPEQLTTMVEDQKKAKELIGNVPLNNVGLDYNPATARKGNKKLQDALEQTDSESITYETYLITQIAATAMKYSDDSDTKTYSTVVIGELQQILDKLSQKQDVKEIDIESFAKMQGTLKEGIVGVTDALNNGCQTNTEMVSYIRNHMESKTQTNKQKREAAQRYVDGYKNIKTDSSSNELSMMLTESSEKEQELENEKGSSEKEKPKVLVKNDDNSGVTSTLTLAIIIDATLLVLAIIGVVIVLC